jgi:hypothetical protein
MTPPDDVRDRVRDRLWALADEARWSDIADVDRARYYETWTRDPVIGGTLAHYMDPRKVRVYIKDSLLKPYERARLSETANVAMRLLAIPPDEVFAEEYIKPHGRRLDDGRIICWSKSRDWKLTLMAAFERAHVQRDYRAYAVLFVESGKTTDAAVRTMIREAANRLGIERLEWID